MKILYALLLILFPFIELPAQNQSGLYDTQKGVNQMQNTIFETIPNAQFPFGQPLTLVKQQDKSPKKAFVLGVYGSAVHAKWHSPDGKVLCAALAVASEPEIFWNGGNAADIISKIAVPPEAGYLTPADEMYNGPSSKALDGLYLAPLGLSRSDAWLCDLVPHSYMNSNQSEAIETRYAPLCEKYGLPTASIPGKPDTLTDEKRRNEILAELEESHAETIVLLGDDPLRWFLSLVSDCKKTKLSEFGEKTYGSPVPVSINGKTYSVIPLAHVRQGGGLGPHSNYWERLHNNWVEGMNRQR
jgi:hypothetical protein